MTSPDKHTDHEQNDCALANGFSLAEKLWAQLSFIGMGVVGTVGIVLADPLWLAPYIVIYWYGVLGVVVRHLACPRCAHLHEFGDCLQAPASVARWLIKKRKYGSFSVGERMLFLLIMIGAPLYPLYWLRDRPLLLGLFLAFVAAWYGGQLLRFCKHCRVTSCPFNRVPKPS